MIRQVAGTDRHSGSLGDVFKHFIHQDHQWPGIGQHVAKLIRAARGGHVSKMLTLAGQLFFQRPPQGLPGAHSSAHHHNPLCAPLLRLVIHGDQGMRLAAAKRGLYLQDRVAPLALQPLLNHIQ